MGHEIGDKFLIKAIGECNTLKLTWTTDTSGWVDQWPLPGENLIILHSLAEKQLDKGHITPTTSPWNTPVLVIRKHNSDKSHLLRDLRKINEVFEDVGVLQPGLPSLTMILQNSDMKIIDLKIFFFNIPLHPNDGPRFAFSLSSLS